MIKVTNKNKKNKCLTFKELKPGDVFTFYGHKGYYYLMGPDQRFLGISNPNGTISFHMSDDQPSLREVVRYKAELIVEEK